MAALIAAAPAGCSGSRPCALAVRSGRPSGNIPAGRRRPVGGRSGLDEEGGRVGAARDLQDLAAVEGHFGQLPLLALRLWKPERRPVPKRVRAAAVGPDRHVAGAHLLIRSFLNTSIQA